MRLAVSRARSPRRSPARTVARRRAGRPGPRARSSERRPPRCRHRRPNADFLGFQILLIYLLNNVRSRAPSHLARPHPCRWSGRRRLSAGPRERAMSRRLTVLVSSLGDVYSPEPSPSRWAGPYSRPAVLPFRKPSRKEKPDGEDHRHGRPLEQDAPAVLLEESVYSVHLSTGHATTVGAANWARAPEGSGARRGRGRACARTRPEPAPDQAAAPTSLPAPGVTARRSDD